MSISSTTRKAGPFAGNDAQTVFPFAFKVFATSDVVVVQADADAAETTLDLGGDYSVTLNGDQDAAPGGNVTLSVALPTGYDLVITSDVPALQAVSVTNGGGFFAEVFNAVFDRLTILVQQLAEKVDRSMKVAITAPAGVSLEVPVTANAVLQWSADGTRLEAVTLPDLSLSLALPPTGSDGDVLSKAGSSAQWITLNYVPTTRLVSAGGLVTGGGALSADRTLTVTAAVAGDVRAGTSSTVAVTPTALMGSMARQTLTDAATIAWDMANGFNATVTPSVSGRTIGAPTHPFDGEPVTLEIVHPAGGGITVSWNAIFNFKSLGTPLLSTAANKRDLVSFMYNGATSKWDCTGFIKDA